MSETTSPEPPHARNAAFVMLHLLAAVAASGFCIYGGIYLLDSRAQSDDSYLELIAHGLGFYMIGKGIFVGAYLTLRGLDHR